MSRQPAFLAFLAFVALPLISAAQGCTVKDTVGVDHPGLTGGGSGGMAGSVGATAGNSGGGGSAPISGRGGVAGTQASGGSGSPMSGGTGGMPALGGQGGGGGSTTEVPSGPQDAECDLRGVWIARLTTFSRDEIFGAVQTASNWFYYVITQSGRDFTVMSSMDCGIQISGSADVTINAATTGTLLKRNEQLQRHGTFYKEADRCAFTLDRFYSTRGVPRATFLPADTSGKPELGTLTPPLPTMDAPAGSEDWDEDGYPGIAYNVALLGTRHVAQRDWNAGFSDAQYSAALGATEFVVRGDFDSQESILATSGGIGGLLMAGATPARDMKHRWLFRRVGASENDPAVAALRGADDLATCYKVQDAMPHDRAKE